MTTTEVRVEGLQIILREWLASLPGNHWSGSVDALTVCLHLVADQMAASPGLVPDRSRPTAARRWITAALAGSGWMLADSEDARNYLFTREVIQ